MGSVFSCIKTTESEPSTPVKNDEDAVVNINPDDNYTVETGGNDSTIKTETDGPANYRNSKVLLTSSTPL
ncbi:hypothetical protein Plhal304r1_c073g0161481 [Plasmopara halstedii]